MNENMPAGEFKAKCLKVLDEVERQREQIVITKVPVAERVESFIGSMHGSMDIVGDIVAPVDIQWEADGK